MINDIWPLVCILLYTEYLGQYRGHCCLEWQLIQPVLNGNTTVVFEETVGYMIMID